MRRAPRTIQAITLCAATAFFVGCATNGRSHTEDPAHSARAAPNPCADKTTTSSNPRGDKAANPCGGKASRDDGTFDPWGDQDQPSNKQQPTDTADSWW